MSEENVHGGCFCGQIRYEFKAGDYTVVDCHCSMCRRTSGAPYVSWVVVPELVFEYTKGSAKELISSEKGMRYFCDQCGTPVVCINSGHPEIVDVTVGSLDEPERFPPSMGFYEDTRLPWLEGSKK